MAMDGKGQFHLSGARARLSDRMASAGGTLKGAGGGQAALEDRGGSHEDDDTPGETAGMTLSKGDGGGYKTEGGEGGPMDHPTLGHALMHLAHHMEPESKHAHVEHDGYEMQSHEAGADGEVSGPHSHENIDALKEHLGQFLNEEAAEQGHAALGDGKEAASMGGEDLY